MYFAMQFQKGYIMVKEGGEVQRGTEQGWGNSQRQGIWNPLNHIDHASMEHDNVELNQESVPAAFNFGSIDGKNTVSP